MVRRLTIVGLAALLLLPSLYANDIDISNTPTIDEVGKALTVITDCISASLVTSCTDSPISLPCNNVQINTDTKLPQRIAFFLADPSEYVTALSPNGEPSKGFFSNLIAMLNSSVQDPLVTAVYIVMSTRGYAPHDYLLSGSISFKYPEGATLQDVLSVWTTREPTNETIDMIVEMNVNGVSLERPLSVAGLFKMGVDETGDIVINSVGVYNINGLAYQGGEFRL
ncbi:MAG: hypothetical protein HUK23_00745 [Sphaerochaetaceae bacterium]|nr:hypothetical protein [Sphaerochaetaceae bacterium]